MKELLYPFDSDNIIKKKKSIRKALLDDGTARFKKKIAVLGGSTTADIVKILDLFLLNEGIEAEFYECEYAQYEQEAIFPSDEFIKFAPDLIFIHTSNRNIKTWPLMQDSKEAVDQKLSDELARFKNIWESLKEKFHCPIVQNNFEMPLYRLLGNKDCYDYRGHSSFICRLNCAMYEYAEKNETFYIHDLNYVSADYGLKEWLNPYYWNMYKYSLCFNAIPYFAFSLSHIIKAIFGRNKKALAIDLDNTLWGGIVGDDGVTGIEIGQENGLAQSYYEFQQYIKSIKPLGILLTICSKNDEENAIDGLNHPEGALRPEDFVIIKANWDSKDRNVAAIASELNITKDAIVFIDDNPVERHIVESQHPGVLAPLMDTVENYIINIDRNGFFEITSFGEDDLKRNDMYRENSLRNAAQAAFSDYGEYLVSLEMKGQIEDFIPLYIPRITQLTNKSNQFNLTTKRYTESDIENIYNSPDYIKIYGKLTDKFGDNGVVSVVIGKIEGEILNIELFLMSCRVLKRDMEQAMLDVLLHKASKKGIKEIRGYYYPTKKNKMVKDLYTDFGFTKLTEDEEGNSSFTLSVEGYKDQNRYIELVTSEN